MAISNQLQSDAVPGAIGASWRFATSSPYPREYLICAKVPAVHDRSRTTILEPNMIVYRSKKPDGRACVVHHVYHKGMGIYGKGQIESNMAVPWHISCVKACKHCQEPPHLQ